MTTPSEPPPSILARLWADMVAAGWRETSLRYVLHAVFLALIIGAGAASRVSLPTLTALSPAALPALEPTATLAASSVTGPTAAPPQFGALVVDTASIARAAQPSTLIATRGRTTVLTYTVQAGDTLFGIAARYNLQPETVLWSNYPTLKDDPHLLRPGQALNILPVDGAYHYVTAGTTLDQIARFYHVSAAAIVDWPGNRLSNSQPTLTPNTYLVIPGGTRALLAWTLPSLPRAARAGARPTGNFGQCAGGYTGIVGQGTFVWPTEAHSLAGYDYSSVHHGLDLRAAAGAPIVAADSGVVMYAGWNDWGYGNLVVLDHGNGWQSAYAHLSQWTVVCGQSVKQGERLGQAGRTGSASSPQLHFELSYNGAPVNPWTVLP